MAITFNIMNRFSGELQFAAEIECAEDAPLSLKIGLAVKWAKKSRADLSGADLSGADLSGANLSGANLSRAKNAELVIARTRIIGEGDLIGWKKCANDVIVKLLIPRDAPRSHAFGRKCRAGFADVLEVFGANKGVSLHDGTTEYVAGARVTAHEWCDDWQQECAGGIHFYISRVEAEAHA